MQIYATRVCCGAFGKGKSSSKLNAIIVVVWATTCFAAGQHFTTSGLELTSIRLMPPHVISQSLNQIQPQIHSAMLVTSKT